ncbi:hypothetical protein ACQEVB_35880 [Pseudonocardia sp. CA-107938]|uniref:COG4705 family protein n=1 Tax=Pseudonocardia sp. CA-107938 TaxID=3240021 RepID=UPI003D90BF20
MRTKVAEVTALFWVIKILTTGMGETASDFLVRRFDPTLVVPLCGLVLAGLLVVQIRAARYRHGLYWATVTMVAVVGTMAADAVHVVLDVGYLTSTFVFAVATTVIITVWRATQPTIAVHSITTRPREGFYWATVGATFALGTAAGDLAAASGLGYLTSGVVFTALIAVPWIAHRWLGLAGVPAFWTAYVLTRPLGASFADWLAAGGDRGGLGLGTGTVTAALTLAIIALVVASRPRTKAPATEPVIAG